MVATCGWAYSKDELGRGQARCFVCYGLFLQVGCCVLLSNLSGRRMWSGRCMQGLGQLVSRVLCAGQMDYACQPSILGVPYWYRSRSRPEGNFNLASNSENKHRDLKRKLPTATAVMIVINPSAHLCLLVPSVYLPRTWRFQTTTKIVGSITDFTPAKFQKKRTCWIRFQVWGNFGLLWYFKNPFAAVLQPQRNHHGTFFSSLGSHRRNFWHLILNSR